MGSFAQFTIIFIHVKLLRAYRSPLSLLLLLLLLLLLVRVATIFSVLLTRRKADD